MNQKSRRGTENLKIGVWISSFFYVKAMCWGLLGKMHPRPGTNSLVSKTGLGFFFATDFRRAVPTYKEGEISEKQKKLANLAKYFIVDRLTLLGIAMTEVLLTVRCDNIIIIRGLGTTTCSSGSFANRHPINAP